MSIISEEFFFKRKKNSENGQGEVDELGFLKVLAIIKSKQAQPHSND